MSDTDLKRPRLPQLLHQIRDYVNGCMTRLKYRKYQHIIHPNRYSGVFDEAADLLRKLKLPLEKAAERLETHHKSLGVHVDAIHDLAGRVWRSEAERDELDGPYARHCRDGAADEVIAIRNLVEELLKPLEADSEKTPNPSSAVPGDTETLGSPAPRTAALSDKDRKRLDAIPELDRDSGEWLKQIDAARYLTKTTDSDDAEDTKLAERKVEALKKARGRGLHDDASEKGIDRDGHVWRIDPAARVRFWYLKSTLGKTTSSDSVD